MSRPRAAGPRSARGLLVMGMMTGACATPPVSPVVPDLPARSVQVGNVGTIGVGVPTQLSAQATLADGSGATVTDLATWSSSDPSILTVSTTGLATGVSEGTATVSARYRGVVGTLATTIRVCRLSFSLTGPFVLALGETDALRSEGQNVCAPPKQEPVIATWSSRDPAIVRVLGNGDRAYITGLAAGTGTVVAAAGGVEVTRAITVSNTHQPSPARIVLDGPAAMPVAETRGFSAVAHWADGRVKDVTAYAEWSSSDPAVASITGLGSVTGHRGGTADIRVTHLGTSSAMIVSIVPIATDAVAPADVRTYVLSSPIVTVTVSATAAYSLVSAPTGRLGVHLRDQNRRSIGSPSADFVAAGAGIRAVSSASVNVAPDVTAVCGALVLTPDGGTAVSAELGCTSVQAVGAQ